ncbi:MAG: type III pantothenate kinase, partial [Bifidobacterium crudilactis]|nr:type III pantothenate kinase [Bifidobacterium crudilactis]
MLVAVDIGNTNIVLGFMDNSTIAGSYRITTKTSRSSDEYGLMIKEFLNMSGFEADDVDDVIITSVVPKVMYSF